MERGLTDLPRRGFTLVELILALAVLIIISAGMTSVGSALFDYFSRPSVEVDGLTYFASPSEDAVEDSIRLFEEFDRLLVTATATYVFGGFSADTGAPTPPLPLVVGFTAGSDLGISARNALTSHIADSRELLTAASASLNPLLEASADPADFTVVVMGQSGIVSGVVQVRRTPTNLAGVGGIVLYDVSLDATTLIAPLSYRFYRPAGEDGMAMNVGARHYWFRSDVTWDRMEKPGTLLIFPDPLNLQGRRIDAETGNYSRYTFWVPTFG